MNDNNFETKKSVETIVFDASGEEIDRMNGNVLINPKNYEGHLPLKCMVIETTTKILSITKVEKGKANE